ncbi:MAG: SAM-dependent methyltransferase [Limisphaerales bacterium]|jgi:SAM-dependent methyltransferase
MPEYNPEEIELNEHAAWDQVWSGALYEDAIAFITSLSGQAEIAIELGEITSDSRVLDVGCGPGLLSESLSKHAASVEGIDFSETMIEQARRLRSGATFQVANAEALPFAGEDFDVVVCCYASHHFARPETVYTELLRVLKPGGRVVVLHPIQAENAAFGAIFRTLGDVFPPEKMETFPELGGPLFEVETPEPYIELLRNCGFTDVTCEKRLKHCSLPNDDALVDVTLQIGKVEEQSEKLRDDLKRATHASAAQYKQADGSYLFPDNILVVKGVRP